MRMNGWNVSDNPVSIILKQINKTGGHCETNGKLPVISVIFTDVSTIQHSTNIYREIPNITTEDWLLINYL